MVCASASSRAVSVYDATGATVEGNAASGTSSAARGVPGASSAGTPGGGASAVPAGSPPIVAAARAVSGRSQLLAVLASAPPTASPASSTAPSAHRPPRFTRATASPTMAAGYWLV